MADHSAIEWTDATWNPMLGCTKVSSGCDNCYAIVNATIRAGNPNEKVAGAYRGLVRYGDWTGRINLLPTRLAQPIRWRKPRRIFVNSQSDLFHKGVPDQFIAKVFAVMAIARHHTFQILTKRHGRMRSLVGSPAFRLLVEQETNALAGDATFPMSRAQRRHIQASEAGGAWPWTWPVPNVWLGVSVEDQQSADLRIPALLETPAAVHWLSCEPLLGPIELPRFVVAGADDCPCEDGRDCPPNIDWVVVGGESGNRARPMHPDWARALRDQCAEGGIPFLFKQWGDHLPVPIVDRPGMVGDRAYQLGGWHAVCIHERGPSGTFRNGEIRPMRVGESSRAGTLLDRDTFAARVGKKSAGRLLDGTLWDEFPPRAHLILN